MEVEKISANSRHKTRTNRNIRVPEVRLIDQDGNQAGILKTSEALERAVSVKLDLVEISPNAEPPVCRIMDYGKYQFEQSKRKSSAKKKQKVTQVKEIKFRPVTDIGDFNVKLRKMREFLENGDKVKVTLRFRGREMQHKELGVDLLKRVEIALEDIAIVEQQNKFEGRQVCMVVAAKAVDTNAKPKKADKAKDGE